MSEITELLSTSVSDLLRDHCTPAVVRAAEGEGWAPGVWRALQDAGLTGAGLPESAGGAGGLEEAAAVTLAAARLAAPVPLAETCVMAGWLAEAAGLDVPAGPLSVAVLRDEESAPVPYGRCAEAIVGLRAEKGGRWHVFRAGRGRWTVAEGANLAGEARDVVRFRDLDEDRPAPEGVDGEALRARGALARAVQIAGAARQVAEHTARYATERVQFGSPLARFQAVQQLLAEQAGEVALASAAVDRAVSAPGPGEIAAAKAAASAAAGVVARIAHQVHGAIGFTDEHDLHLLTRRLWSWRDEYGPETEWARHLGHLAPAPEPWPYITSLGGA
jgi:acyl-CoA dehydrogenase